jgi:hypothetical protein
MKVSEPPFKNEIAVDRKINSRLTIADIGGLLTFATYAALRDLITSGGANNADCAADRRTGRQFGATSAFPAALDQRLPVSRAAISGHDRFCD